METEPRNACQTEHEFVLVLSGISELTPEVEDALFAAGCDDATVSVRFGRVYLTFARAAPSLKDAILSAIRDVRKSGIGAEVLRVDECNLVNQAEIARRMERSRQQIYQYVTGTRGPGGFPPPACYITDGQPLWYWCEVAYWLYINDMIRADVFRDAEVIAAVNAALELSHQRDRNPDLVTEVSKTVTPV